MKLGSSIRRRQVRRLRSIPKWRGAMIGIVLMAVGVGSGYSFSTKVWFPIPEPEGDFLGVTNLRHLDQAEALKQIAGLGLNGLVVDSFRHPTVISGQILGQHPLPGQLSSPGDTVELNIDKRSLDLLVEPSEIRKRFKNINPKKVTRGSGYTELYKKHVLQAPEGCDFDFLRNTS